MSKQLFGANMKRTPKEQLCARAALSVHAPCSLSACVHLILAPFFSWEFVSRKT